jgi:hypothetical protein
MLIPGWDAGGSPGYAEEEPKRPLSPRRFKRLAMQTLRFYTRRIFALVALCFFGFLLLIGSRSPSGDDPPGGNYPSNALL